MLALRNICQFPRVWRLSFKGHHIHGRHSPGLEQGGKVRSETCIKYRALQGNNFSGLTRISPHMHKDSGDAFISWPLPWEDQGEKFKIFSETKVQRSRDKKYEIEVEIWKVAEKGLMYHPKFYNWYFKIHFIINSFLIKQVK